MFSLLRATPPQPPHIFIRTFAKILSISSPGAHPPDPTASHRALQSAQSTEHALGKERIPVKEDHGLYAFFRKKDDDPELKGGARYDTVEAPESMRVMPTGRGWKASELRLKSFNDLHTLWYVVLRERNLLATQKEEARRMGVANSDNQVSLEKVHECRKTMARIKAVINERRLAYEGAVKLVEKQREYLENEKVLQYEVAEHKKERKYLMRRREHVARQREARRKKAEEEKEAKRVKMGMREASEELNEANREEDKPKESERKAKREVEKGTEEAEVKETEEVLALDVQEEKVQEVEVVEEPSTPPPARPVDTVAAGLFGDPTQKTKGRRRL